MKNGPDLLPEVEPIIYGAGRRSHGSGASIGLMLCLLWGAIIDKARSERCEGRSPARRKAPLSWHRGDPHRREDHRPKRGSAPADKLAKGLGTTLAICRGWSSYALCSGPTNRQELEVVIGYISKVLREKGREAGSRSQRPFSNGNSGGGRPLGSRNKLQALDNLS
jgi:hypothetical protein